MIAYLKPSLASDPKEHSEKRCYKGLIGMEAPQGTLYWNTVHYLRAKA